MRLIKVHSVRDIDNIELVGQIFEVVADDLDGHNTPCFVIRTTKGEKIYIDKTKCWSLIVDKKKRFKYVDTAQQK